MTWLGTRKLFQYYTGLCLAGVLLSSVSLAQQGPTNLNISGGLFNSSGTPITSSSVNFQIEIMDKGGTCVLYSEQHLALDLSNTKGAFSLIVGSGTTPVNNLETSTSFDSKIFQNTGVVAAFTGCAGGLTLAAGDARVLRVSYNLGSGFVTMTPDVPITSSAYAMVAESLQGKAATDFILTNTNTSLSQANVESVFTNSNYTSLMALLGGSSTQYIPSSPTSAVGFNSQRLTNVANPTGAQDAATKNYADTNLGGKTVDTTGVGLGVGGGSTLVWNQVQNKWVASLTGSVGLVGSGTGLLGGPITASGTLSVDVGTTANKILQLDTLAQIPAVNGSLLTNVNAASLQTRAISGTAPTAGQVITWNNTTSVWEPTSPSGGTITALTGDVTASGNGSVIATIANNAVNSNKINSAGVFPNRLLITDATTGATIGYSTCALGEVLQWSASGWACESVSLMLGASGVTAGAYGSSTQVPQVTVNAQGRVTALTNINIAFPVLSVAGKTGVVTLNAANIGGLGTAATQNYGIAAGDLVQINGSDELPAVDGSLLTNVNAVQIQSRNVATTAPTAGQVLGWNNSASQWEPISATAGSVTNVASGTGLVGGPITSSGTLSVDVGTAANKILQLNTSAQIPAVDGSLVTSVNAIKLQGNAVSGTAPTAGQVLTYNNSTSQWEATAVTPAATDFVNGGNSFGAASSLGNKDNFAINFLTNNSARMTLDGAGSVGIGTTTPNALLDVMGTMRVSQICDSAGLNCKAVSGGWGAGGSVTNVSAGTGLTGGNITTAGTLNVDVGTAASQILQLNASAQIPAVDGSLLTNVNAANIQGKSVSSLAPTAGQVLTYNNSTSKWEAQASQALLPTLTSADLWVGNGSNAATAVAPSGDLTMTNAGAFTVTALQSKAISATAPTDGQILLYNSTSAKYTPVSLSGSATISDSGSVSLTTTGATGAYVNGGNSFGQAATIGTKDSYNFSLLSNNNVAMTVTTAGNVGIGTTTPNFPLDIQGTASVTTLAAGGGSVGSPGITFSGSPSTGLYSTAANTLNIGISGTQKFFMNNAGYVFWSTGDYHYGGATAYSSSGGPVGVWANASNDSSADNAGSMMSFSARNTATTYQKAYLGAVSNTTGNTPTIVIGQQTGAATYAERLRIDTSGNVGIGTTSPGSTLTVIGTSALGNHNSVTGATAFASGDWNTAAGQDSFVVGGNNSASSAYGTMTMGFNNSQTGSQAMSIGNNLTNPAYESFYIGAYNTTTGAESQWTWVGTDPLFVIGNGTGAGAKSNAMTVLKNGNVGIGTTSPSAALQLKAGGTVASSAPLKFTSSAGSLLTATEDGTMEYDGTNYYLTIGSTRSAIPLAGGTGTYAVVDAGAGSAGAPSISFSGNTNTGFYDAASNNTLSVAAGGAKIFDMSANGIVSPTTGGGLVTSANGTAAAPTYSFAGDTGTGWFRPAASMLAASMGGTERVRIDNNGNVGIGTTSPTSQITVELDSIGGSAAPTTDPTGISLINKTAAAAGAQQISPAIHWGGQGFEGSGPSSKPVDFRAFAIPVQGGSNPTGYLTFQSRVGNGGAYGDRVVISTDGGVGIGTATPVAGGGLTIAPPAKTLGTTTLLTVTGAADLIQAAGVEKPDINFNLARTVQFAAGAIANQRAVRIQAPTYSFTGASTIINAATVDISGPPVAGANATITNPAALVIETGNVGIGTTAPAEKIDVNGGIKIGNSAGTNAGTLRWTGTNFQGYDGSSWYNILPNPPAAGACDTTQTFSASGVHTYTVPASYATITIQLWGGGGAGGSYYLGTGGAGGASTVSSLALSAGGGAGGAAANLGAGGLGGTASGGLTNTNGNSGTPGLTDSSGTGGSAPSGGSGGGGGFSNGSGVTGGAPGGGGSGGGGGGPEEGGGGGSGAHVSKTFTPTTLPFGTAINDIIVGAGGTPGVSGFGKDGGPGGTGRVSVTCSTTGSPPANQRGILFLDTGAYSTNSNFVYDTSGNVGIGTTTPGAKLEVNGALRLDGSTTGYLGFQAPATVTTPLTFTLPNGDGGAGTVLSTDGSGVLSWATVPVTGGSDTIAAGSAAAPSLNFTGDTTTGLYDAAVGTIGVSVSGTEKYAITASSIASTTTGGALMTSGNSTAAAPAFSFTGDTGTGWWRPAASTMAASTGGVERMRIDSSGNVGIGTTSPAATLHVVGSGLFGTNQTVSGTRGFAIGEWNSASNTDTFAGGNSNTASGYSSLAFGQQNTANQGTTIAIGYGNTSSGGISTAIGNFTTASGTQSETIGDHVTSPAYDELVVGAYNVTGGETGASWVSTDPLFVIGNGTGAGAKSNAVTVLKNGNVGIGTISPLEKLVSTGAVVSTGTRVNSGNTEGATTVAYMDAVVNNARLGVLSNANTNRGVQIDYLSNGIATTGILLAPTGYVGIGTIAPAETLDVNGGIRLGSTTNSNAGTLRWTGTNFQGFDGSTWFNILPNPPAAGGCDQTSTFNSPGVNAYTVPASFATITIKVWGAGGDHSNFTTTGTPGGASTVSSLGLNAGGGSGGVYGGTTAAGGAGGVASGGTINTNGNVGQTGGGLNTASGIGGNAPNGGGAGGASCNASGATTGAGSAPGGGSGGACTSAGWYGGGGGGSGAYTEKTYTPATLPPGTTINDIFVGAGASATAGNGRISVVCSTTGSPPINQRGILFLDTGAYTTSPTFVYDTSGNVGIGTTSPASILDVNGSVRVAMDATACAAGMAGAIRYNSGTIEYCNGTTWGTLGGGSASSVSAGNGTAGAPSISFSSDTGTGFYDAGSHTIGVSANGSEVFAITPTSLSSPTTGGALITAGNGAAAAPAFSFTGDTGTGWFRPAASMLGASTGGAERVRIDNNGNVGIGTTSPAVTMDVNGAIASQASYEGASTYVNSGAAYTIPDATVNIRRLTLTANTTITLPAFTNPTGKTYSLTLFLKQDATGNRTVTWAGNGADTIKWDSGAAPVFSPTANKISIIQLMKPADETVWYGMMVWREN